MDQTNFPNLTDMGLRFKQSLSSNPFLRKSIASSFICVQRNWKNSELGYTRTSQYFPDSEYGFSDAKKLEPIPIAEFIWATVVNRVKHFKGEDLQFVPDGFFCSVDFGNSHRDRSSEVASDGFFDRFDLPPNECWLTIASDQLVFWVPKCLESRLMKGIEANCLDVISVLFECEKTKQHEPNSLNEQ
ncbi:MAG: hypothetical protein ACOVQH_04005 [Burkholderiaceae bacterium]